MSSKKLKKTTPRIPSKIKPKIWYFQISESSTPNILVNIFTQIICRFLPEIQFIVSLIRFPIGIELIPGMRQKSSAASPRLNVDLLASINGLRKKTRFRNRFFLNTVNRKAMPLS